MILSQEQWMNLRAFKALAEAGATWAEIARETGYDWRTVKRYLSSDAGSSPPAPAKRGPGPRLIDPYAHLIDAWLRRQPKLKASVIWERLVTEHGFPGHYQRVKVYVREHRARLTQAEPTPVGFHRRFEVLAGAQAQVDWGDEGEIQTATGPLRVSSFHMTLSYSRDPFCCFTAAQDLGTFWDCHRRRSPTSAGCPHRSSMTGPRRWCAAMWAAARPPRCIRRRSRSPATTTLRSGWLPRIEPRPRGGWSVRSRSSAATCWTAAASPRWPSWTPPSPPGCPTAGRRCTAPTARSLPRAPTGTGPRFLRCLTSPMWSVIGTPAGSARMP
jgi:hypothetical protein